MEEEFKELEEQTRLIDIKELARRLDVSMQSVRREVADGKLPQPIQIGRARRWRLHWVREYLDKKEVDR